MWLGESSRRDTAEFRSGAGDAPPRRQNGLRPAALTEVKQALYLGLRLSLCTSPT